MQLARASAAPRDGAIDTMRGVAILMVIGIHALQQPLDAAWKTAFDALLRPCVPIFLFASGYLTGLSGRVPVTKRLVATIIPYAIAFVAAYLYMAMTNPAMDHRITTTIARFGLAYVFVYYYVFVYIGCTLMLWLVLWLATRVPAQAEQRLQVLLLMLIAVGLVSGSYLDPALARIGLSDGVIEEFRMRDIPFWFGFAALGMLVARASAAAYDSTAFFGYAAALSVLLLASRVDVPLLAMLGAGSYFVYLWHIFVVMALRDLGGFRGLGSVAATLLVYAITLTITGAALLALRRWASPRVLRAMGA
ncbi:MAG: acyltransferase family protein [Hyphomicrobiales bacterium]|nr:acyltransferase family protein [Hyphomicrobiales bacterium]